MAAHIILMNAAGPLLAAMIARAFKADAPSRLGSAGILQLLLLYGWHTPALFEAGIGEWHWLMLASLLGASTWYWLEIFRLQSSMRWRAIASLLVTSKLFCLLGVLYLFAPRLLHPDLVVRHGAALHGTSLADQQIAGLLMLLACPATYLLSGVWIAARWIFELEDAGMPKDRRPEMGAPGAR